MYHNNQEKSGFTYTYSAKEQSELKRIREKYAASGGVEDKMARLRRLDASVTDLAQAVALILGVIGTAFLGLGMSLILSDLPKMLGMQHTVSLVLGIVGGVLGSILASFAYPAYLAIVRARRKRLAPEILRLADELMK